MERHATPVRQLANGTNGDDLNMRIAKVGNTIQTVNSPIYEYKCSSYSFIAWYSMPKFVYIYISSIVETGLQHIFHIFHIFSTFFHIFPSLSLHFPNSCHKLHCSKEKMRLPKTLLMDTLILNLKPFLSESSKKVVPQNIFPKLLYYTTTF